MPLQTWTPGAPATAAGIPMIIGNCKDESTLFSRQTPDLFTLDMSGLRERVVQGGVPASAVDELIAFYQRDYPSDSPSDIYFRISTDRGARMNAINQAERKVAQGSGAVYMYYFAWNTPIVDGKMAIKAFHTAELPLAMRLTRYPEPSRSRARSPELGPPSPRPAAPPTPRCRTGRRTRSRAARRWSSICRVMS